MNNACTLGVKHARQYTKSRMSNDHVSHERTHDPSEQNAAEYRSLIVYSIVALALAFTIRFYIAAPYLVQGSSMDPTFHSTDYLIIDRLSYRFDEPERGDVVVFLFPQDPSRSFIKRVIGLPGETVVIDGQKVSIINAEHPDGFTLDEPYIDPQGNRFVNMQVILDRGEYFVLGDNRQASADSRTWGALPRDHIIGRALLRLYPFDDIGINPGSTGYQE